MRAARSRLTKWTGLLVLGVASCASANPPASLLPALAILFADVAHADEGTDAGSNFDNLEVVDAGLNEKVAIMRVGSQQADNNLLAVFAGLKNRTAHRLALEVETIYKDKAGNELNAGSWIPVTLRPYEERDYRSASISEEAVDFLIRVRRASNGR